MKDAASSSHPPRRSGPACSEAITPPERGRGGADRCKKLLDVAKRAGNKPVVELKAYPGARQSFDRSMQGPYHAEGYPRAFHTAKRGCWGAQRFRNSA